MCGICGVIGIESQEESASRLARMMHAMRHRGPDGDGVVVAPFASLGMRRLSIMDLPGGGQPIWNEDGTLAVFFNGEIYNFRELRHELESGGHVFRTHSDTEVIVHGYEAWGEDCVRRLRGMFAFAILESPQGQLGRPARVFLARDRMGIKPLYYLCSAANFYFASEVRALLASGAISPRLSHSALSSYLHCGSVGEPMTLVEGIVSLPAGHCASFGCVEPGKTFAVRPYWGFRDARKSSPVATKNGSPVSQVRLHLEDSVRCHLLADVPLGIFLSSGMDSTALAALACRERPGVKTFTVVFPEREYSEAALARETASRLGTDHAELLLRGEDMCARLDDAVAGFDQPSMDGINTFFVSWAARQAGLKVALSGLGSDEIFGGYRTFRAAPRLARLTALACRLPAPFRRAGAASLRYGWARIGSRPDAGGKLAAAFSHPGEFPHPYFFTRSLFPPPLVRQLLAGNTNGTEIEPWRAWLSQAAAESRELDSFSAISWMETRSYLMNTLLRDTDTMSMANSLEVRVPFLDHPLVELMFRISGAEKTRGGGPKALLAKALADLLPPEIVGQPKRTFILPWEEWLRGPLRERVECGLVHWCPALEPFIEGQAAKHVWQDFLASRTRWSRPWSLFVLNEWIRKNAQSIPEISFGDQDSVTHALFERHREPIPAEPEEG